jgi:hypothetical protein
VKEVRTLTTAQVRLFPPDLIPILRLMIPEIGKKLQALFDFQAVTPVERDGPVTGIAFNGGLYKPDSVVIETVTIEARRILVKVQGKSQVATAVFDAVRKEIEELNGNLPLKEIVCTHETGSSVKIEIPFEQLLSDPFVRFLHESAARYTKNQWSENLILPVNLKFRVCYKITDDTLIKSNITLASKELTIEPRAQSSPDEKLYWIASPTDTDTHFQLIEEFEKALANK